VDRRKFLASTFSILAGRAAARRPNFLFIMADDLGYADVSCYGRRDYQTPHIDGLAREGMRFGQAYANSCVCSPTRTALITGRYQYRLPVGLEEPLAAANAQTRPGLPVDHPTLPSLLRAAGYTTSLVGKWHLGWLPRFGPLQSGYEMFYGYRSGGVDYYNHRNAAGPKAMLDLWDGDKQVDQPGYMTDLLGNRAVEQIAQFGRAKKPFLMSLHFSAPHWPWEAPEDGKAAEGIEALMHHEGGSMAVYGKMVTRMDYQIGRVLDQLRRSGLERDTVVVFTSDNGGERFSDVWPFSGRKAELLEGGVRVPAIVRWPGRVKAGSRTEQVAMSMDWMPTFLAMAGTRPAASHPTDGMDLMPTLTGAAPTGRQVYRRYRLHEQRAMRDGDMKWLRIGGNEFLFDVKKDPQEKANLIKTQPETHRRMKTAFETWNREMLPEDPNAYSYGFGPEVMADRYGNR
jgi:arylsulfatase A-like enzyme